MFFLERIAGPDIEPVTLAELKTNIRAFDSTTGDDDLLSALIVTAREWVEDFTGRALIDQEWRLTIDQRGYLAAYDCVSGSGQIISQYSGVFQFSADRSIYLRKSPALAITSFVSVDSAGVETAIAAGTYELRGTDSKWPRITPLSGATWINGTFRIVFRTGYADRTGSPQDDASAVPNRFKQAIMLYAGALYDRDPEMMPLLMKTAENLIRPECCELGFA